MNLPKITASTLALLILTAGLHAKASKPDQPGADRSGPSVYFPEDYGDRSWGFSVGDALFVKYMFPVSNEKEITQSIAAVDDLFKLKRIIWRGAQSENTMMDGHHVLYPQEDFLGFGVDQKRWVDLDLSEKAAAFAKKRGIEFWGWDSLTDLGYMPWVDAGKGFGPFYGITKSLYENPQWIPVDRIGLRRQGCTFAHSYPEARAAVCEGYDEFLTKYPFYDGIWFYTFVETFEQQFNDEFGYEGPVVEEYKKRYGVDIRTEPFDKQKWYDLKGEYFTQLLRELRVVFNKHGKKLSVTVDPTHMGFPMPWLAGGSFVRATGIFTIEWQKWIDEGLVDELSIAPVGGYDFYKEAFTVLDKASEKKPIKISIWNSSPFPDDWKPWVERRNVNRIMQDMPIMHVGYPGKRPISDIESDDPYAKLNVITQFKQKESTNYTELLNEKMELPAGQAEKATLDFLLNKIVPLLKDENVLVAREAATLLGQSKNPAVVPFLNQGAKEGSPTVRTRCIAALGLVNNGESCAAIRDSVLDGSDWIIRDTASRALAQMGPERYADIRREMKHNNPRVRQTFLTAINQGLGALPGAEPTLIEVIGDEDRHVAYAALFSLRNFRTKTVQDALVKAANGEDLWLAQRAIQSLSDLYGSEENYTSPFQAELVKIFSRQFAKAGEKQKQGRMAWEWRPIGNALYRMGAGGRNALREFLLGNDPYLSDRAWEALYARVDGWYWKLKTEQQAVEDYRFAQNRPGAIIPPLFPEQADANVPNGLKKPYIIQNFDWTPGVTGRQGEEKTIAARWYTPGAQPAPEVQDQLVRSGSAIRLVRDWQKEDRSQLVGERSELSLVNQKVLLSCWVALADTRGILSLGMNDRTTRSGIGLQILGDGSSKVFLPGGKTVLAERKIPVFNWFRVGVLYDLKNNSIDVMVGDHLEDKLIANVPLPAGTELYNFFAAPVGLPTSTAYLDDLTITFED